MIEHAINLIASFYDVPGWVGLEVKGYANLMGALFLLITLVEILIAIHDRLQAKNTSIVDWGVAKFFHLKPTAKI